MLVDSGLVDRDLGVASVDTRLKAFLRFLNSPGTKSAAELAEYVNVTNFLLNAAVYGTMVNQDSPMGNGNNFFIADPGDGGGFVILQYDHDGGALGTLCHESCGGDFEMRWSVAWPTCGALSDSPLFGPLLSDETYFAQYLGYVAAFNQLYGSRALEDELVNVSASLRTKVLESNLTSSPTLRMLVTHIAATTPYKYHSVQAYVLDRLWAADADAISDQEASPDWSWMSAGLYTRMRSAAVTDQLTQLSADGSNRESAAPAEARCPMPSNQNFTGVITALVCGVVLSTTAGILAKAKRAPGRCRLRCIGSMTVVVCSFALLGGLVSSVIWTGSLSHLAPPGALPGGCPGTTCATFRWECACSVIMPMCVLVNALYSISAFLGVVGASKACCCARDLSRDLQTATRLCTLAALPWSIGIALNIAVLGVWYDVFPGPVGWMLTQQCLFYEFAAFLTIASAVEGRMSLKDNAFLSTVAKVPTTPPDATSSTASSAMA
jgi:hypothetical protein